MLGHRVVLFAGLSLFVHSACTAGHGKPEDVAKLLSAIFKRGAAEPKSIPDRQLLDAGVVVVREEIGQSGTKVPREALEGLSGWVLRPMEALQHDADAAGAPKYFVVVESVTMVGNNAVVEWGTDLAIPKREGKVIVVCCSLATDHYGKRGDTWAFDKRLREIVF